MSFRIEIYRYEKKARVAVVIDMPTIGEQTFWLYWDCDSEVFADLLSARMQKQMHDTLERIRETAYEQGYRDGRSKLRKQSWFPTWWRKEVK